jgi:hypothetical protein
MPNRTNTRPLLRISQYGFLLTALLLFVACSDDEEDEDTPTPQGPSYDTLLTERFEQDLDPQTWALPDTQRFGYTSPGADGSGRALRVQLRDPNLSQADTTLVPARFFVLQQSWQELRLSAQVRCEAGGAGDAQLLLAEWANGTFQDAVLRRVCPANWQAVELKFAQDFQAGDTIAVALDAEYDAGAGSSNQQVYYDGVALAGR